MIVSIKECVHQLVINIVEIKVAFGVKKEGYLLMKETERLVGHLKYWEER